MLQIIDPSSLRALEDESAASCSRSAAGVSSTRNAKCTDLGIGGDGTRWRQLVFFPEITWRESSATAANSRSQRLQAELSRLQTAGDGCGGRPLYTVAELPTIGFCATIEHGLLALARSASTGSRLVLGRRSAPTWSSGWLCSRERSLGCYFNFSGSCCAEQGSFQAGSADEPVAGKMAKAGKLGGKRGKLGKRGDIAPGGAAANGLEYGWSRALSLGGGLSQYNRYGTLWVTGQLAYWLFSRMHPHIRAEIDSRRKGVLPSLPTPPSIAARPLCIGMHVRRGDSCSLGSRYCPTNFTSTYFAAAQRLRSRYPDITTLIVATDDGHAAQMCKEGIPGFTSCKTLQMDRVRFDARQSIERRVVHHTTGGLSGSAVALDALADVEMLSECDAHVLVLRSAVSRLALALSVAKKGRHGPLISLQWPWGGMPGPR